MGKPTGFIDWARAATHKREPGTRIADSRELSLPMVIDEAAQQAGRCMDCGVPFCHQGCPLGNLIPEFNDHVFHHRWRAAHDILASTNNFPELTGRLCPAPCEAACVLGIASDDPAGPTGPSQAITIEHLELTIAERAFSEGWVTYPIRAATGKRVAIVGSGPAGLAAADQLVRVGHDVTVYERADRIGGLLAHGIPDFKLDKAVLQRRLALMESAGVRFVTDADVGVAPRWDQLRDEHDALNIAVGATRPRTLDLPGVASTHGVVQAMDFLTAQNRALADGTISPMSAKGQRVVILGGGDTGSDCLGTALRQGAADVTQVELMPMPPAVRSARNPWPQWPLVFRVSSSQEEGGGRLFGRRTVALRSIDGKLSALTWTAVELHDGQLVDVPGTERSHEVDRLILAMGFSGPDVATIEAQLGVQLDGGGRIRIDADRRTSVPKVYCAGDASRGASLVVWAISDGREAARAVDTALMGASELQTRGRDAAFGGR